MSEQNLALSIAVPQVPCRVLDSERWAGRGLVFVPGAAPASVLPERISVSAAAAEVALRHQ